MSEWKHKKQEEEPEVKATSTDDGKTVVETEHADGRKDVEVKVNRLDVSDDEDPEVVKQANKAIRKGLADKIDETQTLIILLHKPTHERAARITNIKNMRAYAESAIAAHGGDDADPDEYVILAFEFSSLRLNEVKMQRKGKQSDNNDEE